MKRILLPLLFLVFTFGLTNAQFSVFFVDDDDYNDDESATIVTALANSGYTYDTYNIDTNAVVTYEMIKDYDMVIWYTSSDGVGLNLWDLSDTAGVGPGLVKYNEALTQFADSGGIIWVDGLDFIYDLYEGAPDTFATGDFVYDVLGISKYLSQSHVDDGFYSDGVEQMDITTENTITTVDPIMWKWSTLWYGDGYEITPTAVPLYTMGPTGYDLEGQVSALYNQVGNATYITSTLRIASLGDGSAIVQSTIDQLVKEVIDFGAEGGFLSSHELVSSDGIVSVYPNPSSGSITISLPENMNSNVDFNLYNLTGQDILHKSIKSKNAQIQLDNLSSGVYFYTLFDGSKKYSNKLYIIR